MAFEFQGRYSPAAEEQTRAFFKTLSERDQRRFAALEARRLGWDRVCRGSPGVFDTDDPAGNRRMGPVA